MVTQQRNTPVQSPQDFIRIQDLFYLCLGKWHWFVVSLAVCLGIAVWYLLTTPPVYTRSASILIKDDSKGKSASTDMETFSDFGLFTSNTNVNNEMGTLQSPDLMREVVSRLHLDMDYKVSGRFHRQTVYGRQPPSASASATCLRTNPLRSPCNCRKVARSLYPTLSGMARASVRWN